MKVLKGLMVAGSAFAAVYAGTLGYTVFQDETAPEETMRVKVMDSYKEDFVVNGTFMRSRFVVRTENERFETSNTYMGANFNASALQNKFQRGCEFEMTVSGVAHKAQGVYRDIESARHIPTPACPKAPGR